jgi:3',5'-cyclic AMP phosphodiesterase CpdA
VDGAPMSVAFAEVAVAAVRTSDEHQMWAHLDGLLPDTIYCYALRNDVEQLTQPTGFRTPPAADSTRPLRFMAFGDSGGGGSDQYELLDQMYTVPYDVIIHTGDLAYDNGTIGQFEDNVFGVYFDLLRNIPMFPAAGNHDNETMQGAPFRDVFALPSAGDQKWYAFDWGRIHFAALDTEADYRTQAAWLDRDLASTELPWKVVYLHKPPYSSGTHGSDLALRAALAPVVERHHVQLVLAGHDHDYERIVPQNGVAYIVTGGGGVGTRSVGSSSFTAFSDDVIHFVYGEVGMDQLDLHGIDATGVEFDSAAVPL